MNYRFLLSVLVSTIGVYLFTYSYLEDAVVDHTILLVLSLHIFLFYFFSIFISRRNMFSPKGIFVFVFLFSILFVGLFNYLFFIDTGSFFEFTESDSTLYHEFATITLNYGFFEGIQNFMIFSRFDYDDAGMIAYLSIFYRVIEHPLFVRFVNVIIHASTVCLIYKISRCYLKENTSALVSLIYGMSSFAIYYVSSGMKETVFTFLVVLSFYNYSLYKNNGGNLALFKAFIFSAMILFFRIPVALFLFLSFAIVEFWFNKISITKTLVVFLSVSTLIVLVVSNYSLLEHYLSLGNPNENAVSSLSPGFSFKLLVVIAGFFGPFPTFIPVDGYKDDSIWAATLILKVFLSIYFIFGVFFAYKWKHSYMTVLVLFCLLNIFGLVLVDNTFKVRYILPYIPLFLIVVGYAYDVMTFSANSYAVERKLILPINLILLVVMFYWNILRL